MNENISDSKNSITVITSEKQIVIKACNNNRNHNRDNNNNHNYKAPRKSIIPSLLSQTHSGLHISSFITSLA